MIKNTITAYGSVTRFFHWTIFFLVLVMVPLGFLMIGIEDKELKGQVINIHKLIGLLILSLMLMRAFWALINIKPLLPFATPFWEKVAERFVHYLLYLGLFLMPLSGWLGSSWGGKPPHIGNFNINFPVSPNKDMAGFSFEYIHQPLALVLIALISIHVLAALYHHFVRRDDILRRMLKGE